MRFDIFADPLKHAPSPTCLALTASEDASNVRKINLTCFREAGFGLFLHYGLYSLLEGRWSKRYVNNKGVGWIQWWAPVPRKGYMTRQQCFRPDNFDTEAECGLACEAGMS